MTALFNFRLLFLFQHVSEQISKLSPEQALGRSIFLKSRFCGKLKRRKYK
jgi:hypothetical protein